MTTKKSVDYNDPEALKYSADIESMVLLRQQQADHEAIAKQMKDSADEIFIGLKNLLMADEITTKEGTYSWVVRGDTESIDTGKLKDALLKMGFDSDRVLEAFKAATVVKKGSQYAMWKGKKGGK